MKRLAIGLSAAGVGLAAISSGVEVGYWGFNEGQGTSITDGSTFGNHGTLVNASAGTWTSGKLGSGLYFSGVSGSGGTRVDVPDAVSLRLSVAGSFAAWMYSEDVLRDAPLLAKEGHGGLGYWFGTFGPSGAGHWGVLADQNGGYNWDFDGRNQGSADGGRWTHLAATWDGTNVRYYVDGSHTNTIAWGGLIFASPALLSIGANSEWLTTAFKGTIDEVHLYDHAISDADVARLAAVPEPASLAVLGMGVVGLLSRRRRC